MNRNEESAQETIEPIKPPETNRGVETHLPQSAEHALVHATVAEGVYAGLKFSYAGKSARRIRMSTPEMP